MRRGTPSSEVSSPPPAMAAIVWWASANSTPRATELLVDRAAVEIAVEQQPPDRLQEGGALDEHRLAVEQAQARVGEDRRAGLDGQLLGGLGVGRALGEVERARRRHATELARPHREGDELVEVLGQPGSAHDRDAAAATGDQPLGA